MTRRAFVVVGPESAGNRMCTAILVEAGCMGQASVLAPLNHGLPENGQSPVVLTRSYPHGGDDPDIFALRGDLQALGYQVHVIVVVRDMAACEASQVQRQHQRSLTLARLSIQNALGLIFSQLHLAGVPFYVTTYEALANHAGARDAMLEALGLPGIGSHVTVEGRRELLEDRNGKHYPMTVGA